MIVYVETNFILELAFEQEQLQAANEILKLAEQSKVEFAFNCKYIKEFKDGLGYIESELRKAE